MREAQERVEIIHEDNDIIVCYKPAGVAAETRRSGQQDMVSILRNGRAAKGEPTYIGMVHRLDQPVEGLMVFAKTQSAAAELTRQIMAHSFGKYYYAVGRCLSDVGADGQKAVDFSVWEEENNIAGERWATFTDYLYFDRKRNLSVITEPKAPQAKRAQLQCRIVGQKEGLVCFDIALDTGRHHQIRVQMAHHGFVLAGDRKYGQKGEETAGGQLALCAYRLIFDHPSSKKRMDFSIRPHNRIFEPFTETIPAHKR